MNINNETITIVASSFVIYHLASRSFCTTCKANETHPARKFSLASVA